MSVKVSRREEKRDTSIRDFSLAAVFPLLLTGLIGYYIGVAGKADTQNNQSMVTQLRDSLDYTKEKMTNRDWVVGEIDSILTLFTKFHEARKEEFAGLSRMDVQNIGMESPLDNWITAENSDYSKVSQAISALRGQVDAKPNLDLGSVDPLLRMLKDLTHLSHNYFNIRLQAFNGQTDDQRQLTQNLTECQEACDEQVEELQFDLKQAKREIQTKDLEITDLSVRLRNNGEAAGVTPVSYSGEKSLISNAVLEIESISRQLPSGVFSGNKREQVEANLLRQTETIKQALAVIE